MYEIADKTSRVPTACLSPHLAASLAQCSEKMATETAEHLTSPEAIVSANEFPISSRHTLESAGRTPAACEEATAAVL